MSSQQPLDALYRRPAFLMRRVHQVAIALFDEECAKFGVTNTQHGLLQAIQSTAGIDVVGAARLVGIDRTTAHVAVANLERNGWIKKTKNPADRRSYLLSITAAGTKLLRDSQIAINRAQTRLLRNVSAQEIETLVDILQRIAPGFPLNSSLPVATSPSARPRRQKACV